MGLIEAIVLGIVQGLTEFLPISSTAHLRIVPALLGWSDPGAAFSAVIQIGTVLAVLIYFWKDLSRDFGGWLRSLKSGEKDTPEARIGWAIFWGSIPIVLLGLLLHKAIESDAVRSLYVISATLIVMGVVMAVAERVGVKTRMMDDVTPRDGLKVGLWQCLALIPGMSRSGSSISGALFTGFDRPTAARFSFLLSVPSVLGAGLYELYKERHAFSGSLMIPAIAGTLAAFVVGYASIAFLIRFLQKRGIGPFVAYRIFLGLLILFLISTHRLSPQTGETPTLTVPPTQENVNQ